MLRLLVVASLLTIAPIAVHAQGAAETGGAVLRAIAGSSFNEADRREIEQWFRLARRAAGVEDDRKGKHGKDKGLPPGLAKRDALPPGLAKRDTLPPGLAKRDLPGDLERKLSRLPKGTRRSQVGDDIVLIEEATGVILDILRGVAR